MLGNNHPLLHITITYYQHIWGNGHPLISYSISLKVQIWHPAYTPWALWPASLQDPRGQDSRRETHGGTTQMAMNIWKDLESDHEALDHWGPIFKQTHVYKRFLLVKQHPWTRWTIVSWVDFSHRCTMWLKEKDCKFPKVSDLMILMESHEARPRIIIDLGLRRVNPGPNNRVPFLKKMPRTGQTWWGTVQMAAMRYAPQATFCPRTFGRHDKAQKIHHSKMSGVIPRSLGGKVPYLAWVNMMRAPKLGINCQYDCIILTNIIF